MAMFSTVAAPALKQPSTPAKAPARRRKRLGPWPNPCETGMPFLRMFPISWQPWALMQFIHGSQFAATPEALLADLDGHNLWWATAETHPYGDPILDVDRRYARTWAAVRLRQSEAAIALAEQYILWRREAERDARAVARAVVSTP